MEFIEETPRNIDELLRKARDKQNWENRLAAVHELGKYDCRQSRDKLTELALHDKVFEVKEAAFKYAQGLGIQKNNRPLRLGRKDIKYKNKDFTKVFKRVKRESHMEEFDLQSFKEKFKIVDGEMYDVMQYEKKQKFDGWITNTYNGLPK